MSVTVGAVRVGLCALVVGLCSGCSSASDAAAGSPCACAPPDGGSKSVDAAAGIDSGAARPPPPEDVGGTCTPGDVMTFTPTWHPPTGPYTGACTDAQLDALIKDCFVAAATAGTCNAWLADSNNTACTACWVGQPSPTAMSWAPFLYVDNPGQVDFVNVAGCLVLADPSLYTCAHSIEAMFTCDLAACQANCPVPQNASTVDVEAAESTLSACFEAANETGCEQFAELAAPCIPSPDAGFVDAGPASFCSSVGSDPVSLRTYFDLACGVPHDDADAGVAYDGGDGGR